MKITIIGGSVGGLVTGISLLKAGFDVNIYERSPSEMRGRGAGLVIQPNLKEFVVDNGISTKSLFGVAAEERQILDINGNVISRYGNDTSFSSWNYLWKQLRDFFPDNRYHYGARVDSVSQDDDGVYAKFDNGKVVSADLLIGADGYSSVTRENFLPQVQPIYAGYIAYRGLIEEKELSRKEADFFDSRFTLFPYDHSHLLAYLIPGQNGELTPGKRLLNWVWFVNKSKFELEKVMTDKNGITREFSIPSGYINELSRAELHTRAKRELPTVFSDCVLRTEDPFVQAIIDMEVPRMYDMRIVLIGDAAFLVRPHTASGTAKAYEDGAALALALTNGLPLERALSQWNRSQMDYAMSLVHYGKMLAAQSGLGHFG